MPPKSAAKRKASDDPPSVTKRTRKDPPETTTKKRKAPNGEVVGSGLVIIRDPPSRNSSQQSVRLPDASSSMSRSPPPPTKKLKVSPSDPPPRAPSAKGKERAPLTAVPEEQDVEEDVRAMENEANDIRRRSMHSSSFTNHAPLNSHTDTLVPLEPRETPRIEANRAMRGETAGPSTPRQKHGRRSSFSSRGKRASMGSDSSIITTPHRSVEDKHFYRHLDYDSPDAARMSELLVWCMKRSLSLDPSERTSKMSGKDPPRPLSDKQNEILRDVVDSTIKMLRERKIDTSVDGSERPDPRTQVKGNEQNEKNRARHVRFTADINRLNAEMEAWNQVDKFYEKLKAGFEAEARQRKADAAKAKGKRRADPEQWLKDNSPRLDELSPTTRARAEEMMRIVSSPKPPPRVQESSAETQYKVDRLNTRLNAGAQVAAAIEMDLDRRFALLSLEMQAREQPASDTPPPPLAGPSSFPPSSSSTSSTSTSTFSRAAYDPRDLLRALTRADIARPPAQVGDGARRAAREVKRVQEGAGAGGGGGVADRRLTGLPPPTPRKAPPGTPRRVGTPGARR